MSRPPGLITSPVVYWTRLRPAAPLGDYPPPFKTVPGELRFNPDFPSRLRRLHGAVAPSCKGAVTAPGRGQITSDLWTVEIPRVSITLPRGAKTLPSGLQSGPEGAARPKQKGPFGGKDPHRGPGLPAQSVRSTAAREKGRGAARRAQATRPPAGSDFMNCSAVFKVEFYWQKEESEVTSAASCLDPAAGERAKPPRQLVPGQKFRRDQLTLGPRGRCLAVPLAAGTKARSWGALRSQVPTGVQGLGAWARGICSPSPGDESISWLGLVGFLSREV